MNIGKTITLLLIIVLAVGLVSCAASPTPTSPLETPVSIKETATPEKLEATATPVVEDFGVEIANLKGLQIHFLHPWTGETYDLLFQLVDQFNQTNEWGIHVIMNAPGSAAQVTRRLREEIVNDIPSSVAVASISELLAISEEKELVVDLAPYIASAAYGMDENLVKDFYPLYWNENHVNGKQYGIPAQRSALLLAYNSTWANELGFTAAPRTTEEFSAQMCAANASFRKDEDPSDDGLGGWIVNNDPVSMYNWLLAFEAAPYNDGSFVFDTPSAEKAFTFLHTLRANACAWMGSATPDADYFARRQALAYSLWMQDLGRQSAAMTRNESGDQWMVMAYPGMAGGALLTGGSSFAVLHQSAEKDLAAWLFVRWLSQPAQQARLLAAMGTLPLGDQVMGNMQAFGEDHPYWLAVVDQFDQFMALPADADWQIVAPVLEDAAWQLWVGGIGEGGVAPVLKQMDALITELSGEPR